MNKPPTQIGSYYGDSRNAQTLSDVAVIMPTILRPEIVRAVKSVFRQEGELSISILIGVDVASNPIKPLEDLLAARPPNVSATILTLPYSTSARNGGVHAPLDGGSLRAILGFMANSRYLAFLDDDNEWLPNHLAALCRSIKGKAWAHSHRILVDDETDQDVCRDVWDSVGVGRGRFARSGGFVDPNCLMVDKVRTGRALSLWANPVVRVSAAVSGRPVTGTADRSFFEVIAPSPHATVTEATVRYRIRKTNLLWRFIRERAQAAAHGLVPYCLLTSAVADVW